MLDTPGGGWFNGSGLIQFARQHRGCMDPKNSTDPQPTPTTGGSTHTKIKGGWLTAARTAWIILVLLNVGIFLYGFFLSYEQNLGQLPRDGFEEWSAAEVRTAFAEVNISTGVYATYIALLDGIPFLIGLGIGVLIFWRRSDIPIGLLASYAAITLGITNNSAWFFAWDTLRDAAQAASFNLILVEKIFANFNEAAIISLLLIFPNGRFSPKWTRWGLGLLLFYYVVETLTQGFLQDWGNGLGWFITLAIIGLPTYSQFYRYRTSSSEVERQQIKWLVFSLAAMFVVFAALIAFVFSTPTAPEPSGAVAIGQMVMVLIITIPVTLLPISIGIAVTRYRLWEINILINRSLVYGLVTVTLGAVFMLGFAGIQTLLKEFFGAEQALYPAIISGALVAGLFTPTTKRLRHYVDKRFYGIDLDYTDVARQEEELVKTLSKEEPASSFGKYTALGLIGRGGMGEVYKANDPDTGNTVAIKTLYIRGEGDEEELVKRFHREAQAIEGLEHKNIVRLFDYGEEEDLPYMVMEYVEGKTISELVRGSGGIPLDEALPLFEGIASALDYAHGKGIVHRDIKPSNVIIEDGKQPRAVLMDFGIARMVSAMTALTGTGGMVGTLDYISPEQIQGAHEVDRRADVYSLGAMVYQTLTGELPFKHRNPGALIMAHLSTPPPDARELVKDLPRIAAKAIQKAMAKEAGDRFETAGEFVQGLSK